MSELIPPPATPPSWAVSMMKSMETGLNRYAVGAFTFTEKEGLVIAPTAPDDALEKAAQFLENSRERTRKTGYMLDRWMGQIICEYSARHNVTYAEAINQLKLCEHTGSAFKTLEKLPRMVTRNLPESFLLPGLTTSHFDTIAGFSGPTEPDKKAEWQDRCHEILVEASTNPKERGRKWLNDQMRELQKEFGVAPKRPVAASIIQINALKAADILLSWTEADFTARGWTRGQVLGWWEAYRADLVDRDVIPDGADPLAYVVPWEASPETVVDVEPETDSPAAGEAPPENEEESEEAAQAPVAAAD